MMTKRAIWTILAAGSLIGAALLVNRSHGRGDPLAPRQPENLSADGTILLRGKPFFPIGLYQVRHTAEEYALLAANGFNAIQGHFTTDTGQFIATLDLAQRHHLAVAVPLHAQNLIQENLARSLDKIRAAKHHPAVLSWKICDEPDSNAYAHLRPEVPTAYRAIKALNPPQPVELTLCKDPTLADWTPLCELVEIDRYPVPDRPLTDVLDFCQRTRKVMLPWQNLTCVVQCGWTRDLKTQPTFHQARAMVYLALIGGAKGIFWYSRQEKDGWDLTATPLWPRMKEINAEIASLADPILLGKDAPGIRCNTPGVRFIAKRHSGRLYLLATNPTDAPADAVFTLPAALQPRSAKLAGTDRSLVQNGASIHLPLGEVDSATVIFDF